MPIPQIKIGVEHDKDEQMVSVEVGLFHPSAGITARATGTPNRGCWSERLFSDECFLPAMLEYPSRQNVRKHPAMAEDSGLNLEIAKNA